MFTLIQGLQDPAALKTATTTAIEGANLAMKHIMESFDIRNPDRLLITIPTNVPAQPQPNVAPSGIGGTQSPSSSSSVQSNLILAPNAQSIMPNIPSGLQGMG